MINTEDFVEQVDVRFWKHITREARFVDVIKFKDISREECLRTTATDLNKFRYNFGLPLIENVPKENGVLRKVKSYPLDDTCIYYYVTKKLQEEIVLKIREVDFVYGGFRMTPELQVNEEDFNEEPTNSDYENQFSRTQFRKEWAEYQNMAKSMFDEEYLNYLHFDIAHFYDDINLSILESILQDISSGKSDLVNLLFFFLKNSDRLDLGYQESTVGLPQESVGEMSRLLANLYLSRFDSAFNTALANVFGEIRFKYIRYADDMWVVFDGPRVTYRRVIQTASTLLQKQKLHLNESKTEILSRDEFRSHWQFDLWDEVIRIKDDANACLHKTLDIQSRYSVGRWFSPMLYCLKVVTSNPENVNHFVNDRLAMKYVGRMLGNPKYGLRVNGANKDFFVALFKKYRILDKEVVRPMVDRDFTIYPNVQIFALELLVECSDRDNLHVMVNRYLKTFRGQSYHWYLRCLCLRYMSKYGSRISEWKVRDAVLDRLASTAGEQNFMERRYSIYFLMSMTKDRGRDVLDEHFNLPNDLKFRKYIKEES
jgi:hypothetical protein